jgi:hypothetical protein
MVIPPYLDNLAFIIKTSITVSHIVNPGLP